MHKKSNFNPVTIGFFILIVLIATLVILNSLRRTTYVTLPSDTTDSEQTTTLDTQDTINAVSVTPDTVQGIIASLSRSDYRRTLRIEQIWSGGSGTTDITVTQIGDYQRIDQTLLDGRVQHTISSEQMIYTWFDDDEPLYQSPLGEFNGDQLQGIPTYEDVLDLSAKEILSASYQSLSGVRCIYVETTVDDDGYQSLYWISVDSGLLVAAERLEEGEPIYRMAVVSEETITTPNTYFLLPTGIDLIIG